MNRMGKASRRRKEEHDEERNMPRNWDPSWRNQIRVQIMGDSNDITDIRPMADHLDLFQRIYRDRNEKADRFTHEAREKGASCDSFTMM